MYRFLACLTLIACVEDPKSSTPDDAALSGDAGADVAVDAAPDMTPPVPDAAPPEPDSAPIAPCANEDELAPNQRPSAAFDIEQGFDRSDLFACPGVSDWYALRLDADEIAKVALVANPDRTDLDLRVVDADGAELAGSFGETGTESVNFQAPTAGVYLIEVASYRDQTSSYGLSVRRGCRLDESCGDGVCDTLAEACTPFVRGACGADDHEPNDRHDAASPLDEGSVSGSVCPQDRDWYALNGRDGDRWEINVTFDAGQNVDLIVLGPTGRLVDAALGDAGRNPERVVISNAPAGRYLVGVSMPAAEGARATDYTVIATAASGECTIDRDCLSLGLPDCQDGLCVEVPDGGAVKPGDRCGRGADCGPASQFCFQGDPGGHDNLCTRECESGDDCAEFGDATVCDRTLYGSICAPPCSSDDDCTRYNRCDADRGDCRLRGRCNADGDCDGDEFCSEGLGFGGLCELRE